MKENTVEKENVEQRYCVFNKTQESFLSLSVSATDTHFARLRGLIGRLRLKFDEGIWVVPSKGVHTIGVLFAIDLIYLDDSLRVIQAIESFGTFRIGPIRTRCSSVLELPTRTIYSSNTQVGDELLICSPDEMEQYLEKNQARESVKTTVRQEEAPRRAPSRAQAAHRIVALDETGPSSRKNGEAGSGLGDCLSSGKPEAHLGKDLGASEASAGSTER